MLRRGLKLLAEFTAMAVAGPLVGLLVALALVPGLGMFVIPFGLIAAVGIGGPPSALTALFVLLARRRLGPAATLLAATAAALAGTMIWLAVLAPGQVQWTRTGWLLAAAAIGAPLCAFPFAFAAPRPSAPLPG